MAATPNINLTLPTVGGDSDTWGGELNADLSAIDALWANIGNVAFGSAATKSTGTSGATVPLLNGTNTWAQQQTFANGLGSGNDITVNRGASSSPTTGAIFFGNTGGHYFLFDGTNFAVGGSGGFYAPAGGFVGFLTGNVSGNVSGNLSGNVTGNVSGSSGSCTGNAATASSTPLLSTGNWTISEVGGSLCFEHNGSLIGYMQAATGFTNNV